MGFKTSLDFVLKWEGGYVDHPKDPGGATCCGVTQTSYNHFTKSNKPVKDITKDEVAQIYKELYWYKCHADEMPNALALVVFDSAVNCGVNRAVKWLQMVIETVPDGIFGNVSRTALSVKLAHVKELNICANIIAFRRNHYRACVTANKSMGVFSKGWENRVTALEKEIAAL
jgi:lysozyme family protein